MSMAAADAVAFKTNTEPVTFAFTSARVLQAGQRITITLPANYFEGRANPFVSVVSVNPVLGVAIPNVTCTLVATPQCIITCVTAGSILEARSYRMVFGVGQLSTGPALAQQTNGLAISTTVDGVGFGASPTKKTHSIVFQNVLDMFSQKRTSGFVDVTFFPSTLLPAGGRVTIHLPNQLFTANPQPMATVLSSGDPPTVACALSASSIICTTSIRALTPGVVVLRFLPATLTTGISRSETSNLFRIETSAEAATNASVTPAIADGRVRFLVLPAYHGFQLLLSSFSLYFLCQIVTHFLHIQNVNMTMSEDDQNARKTTTSPVMFYFTAQSDIMVRDHKIFVVQFFKISADWTQNNCCSSGQLLLDSCKFTCTSCWLSEYSKHGMRTSKWRR